MTTIKRLMYLYLILICSSNYVAMAMDNPLALHPLPAIVCEDRQQFENRYMHILRQNMTRMSIALQHESAQMREKIMYNYEQQMLNDLRDLLHRQRRRDSVSTTMTNLDAV